MGTLSQSPLSVRTIRPPPRTRHASPRGSVLLTDHPADIPRASAHDRFIRRARLLRGASAQRINQLELS
jgi:hypothetical protein